MQGENQVKVYTALLTQTGTSAPVVQVLANGLGEDVVWTRGSAGNYYGTTTTSILTEFKTTVIINNTGGIFFANWTAANEIWVSTGDLTGTPTDVLLNKTMIEIRVYETIQN